MLFTPHTNHAIDILRIEHRDTRIGPCVYVESLQTHNKHLEAFTLMLNPGIDIILESTDPIKWKNNFGDTWRHNMQLHHNNVRHPDNLLWQFGVHINTRTTFIQQCATLLTTDAADFVIATYTCPINTWCLHAPDQQIAFRHDQAIRHHNIIDQHNIHNHINGDTPTSPCMADIAPKLSHYMDMFNLPTSRK